VSKPIRVMIVDDHDMLREGLATFLKAFPDLLLVGEASSGEDAVASFLQTLPDIILMDLIMPGLGGVAAIEAIHRQVPRIGIIALSSFDDADLVKSSLKAGARSYLLKNISADRLADAIRSTYSGLPTFAPEVTATLLAPRSPQEYVRPDDSLTAREKSVLELLARGFTNAQMAMELEISVNTVKNHVLNIFNKLGANNRTEAARFLLKNPTR
jgi:two-component system, NarL family, response regulator LiaR